MVICYGHKKLIHQLGNKHMIVSATQKKERKISKLNAAGITRNNMEKIELNAYLIIKKYSTQQIFQSDTVLGTESNVKM